jgi:ABC-type branched-subunit amino acid transport system substrate-binding protein
MKQLPIHVKLECANVLSDCTGFILTESQIDTLIKNDQNVISDLLSFGPNDTVERERLCDLLAEHLVGRHWPLFMDTDAYSESFHKELAEKAIEKGFKKVDNKSEV